MTAQFHTRLIPPLWDLVFDLRGPDLCRWDAKAGLIYSMNFNCDETLLSIPSYDKFVDIRKLQWSRGTSPPGTIYSAADAVFRTAWHPKLKNVFAFAGTDHRIAVGNYPEKTLQYLTAGPISKSAVVFKITDGSQIYASSWDGAIRVFDTSTHEFLSSVEEDFFPISMVSTPDFLAVGTTSGAIDIWDMRRHACTIIGDKKNQDVTSLDYNGDYLLASRSSGGIHIWDIRTWRTIDHIPLAVSFEWGTVQFYDSQVIFNMGRFTPRDLMFCGIGNTGTQVKKLLDNVLLFTISPLGGLLATIHVHYGKSAGVPVQLWDMRNLVRSAKQTLAVYANRSNVRHPQFRLGPPVFPFQ